MRREEFWIDAWKMSKDESQSVLNAFVGFKQRVTYNRKTKSCFVGVRQFLGLVTVIRTIFVQTKTIAQNVYFS